MSKPITEINNELERRVGVLSDPERGVFTQLFINGPTFDADLLSMLGRDGLCERGLAVRNRGFQQLSERGFSAAMEAGYGITKDIFHAKRMAVR